MSTLTFVYADSTAVLGPLSRSSEPHTYDLCQVHSERLTAPVGWELLRVEGGDAVPDDLVALAEALRPACPAPEPRPAVRPAAEKPAGTGARHLSVVRSPDE